MRTASLEEFPVPYFFSMCDSAVDLRIKSWLNSVSTDERCIFFKFVQHYVALLWTCTDHLPKLIKQESTLMSFPLFISSINNEINTDKSDCKLYLNEGINQIVN